MFTQLQFTITGNILSWMIPIPDLFAHAVEDLSLEFRILVSSLY